MTRSHPLTCPGCEADATLIVDGQCEQCAEGRVAEWIERLQP
jgi:predicted amidophosphoribosyltransferase